ncbi:helix-turn-helix transcriptional regulator [Hyphomicrobium sp.]|jgi:DNA-binding CsgD family transcriptional regulator|uniref:helix-turn-helix transcriptional regulator n=1 Tax=Hyphomicrobium sp. TaxID=82 RepID=UPI003562BBED
MTISAFVAEDLPALLDLLYGAALDKDRWPAFLEGLMKPFDGANGILHFFDIETQTTPAAHTFGLESKYLIGYQEHFSSLNPYPIQSFAKLPLLQVLPATSILSRDEALGTEFYNDWMKPQGISPEHLGCMVYNEDREMVVLAISPSTAKLERNVDRYTEQFQLLAPHLKRAIALSKVSRTDVVRGGLPAQFSCGAMVISQSRAIKAANPPAERLLQEGLLLSIDPLGKLRVKDRDMNAEFVTAAETVFVRREPVGGPVYCRMPLTGDRASIIVLKLPPSDVDRALVLLITKENGAADLNIAQFTGAEARLARALLNGQTLAEFSEEVGISINTARKQLAALFSKTGTNRQAALVAWLLQRGS